jgi:hypothetical protein
VVDLVPLKTSERLTHRRAVLREHLAVALLAKLREEFGRPFDVGEDERDRA